MNKSEAGKLGERVSHKKRYELLLELSALVDKKFQNHLLKWPTEHLEKLLEAYKHRT